MNLQVGFVCLPTGSIYLLDDTKILGISSSLLGSTSALLSLLLFFLYFSVFHKPNLFTYLSSSLVLTTNKISSIYKSPSYVYHLGQDIYWMIQNIRNLFFFTGIYICSSFFTPLSSFFHSRLIHKPNSIHNSTPKDKPTTTYASPAFTLRAATAILPLHIVTTTPLPATVATLPTTHRPNKDQHLLRWNGCERQRLRRYRHLVSFLPSVQTVGARPR